jgi:hypothetical protein
MRWFRPEHFGPAASAIWPSPQSLFALKRGRRGARPPKGSLGPAPDSYGTNLLEKEPDEALSREPDTFEWIEVFSRRVRQHSTRGFVPLLIRREDDEILSDPMKAGGRAKFVTTVNGRRASSDHYSPRYWPR